MKDNSLTLLELLVGKEKAAMYFLPFVVLITAAALLLNWADSRRRKRAQAFNMMLLCGICGEPLGEQYSLIPISGIKLNWKGTARSKCVSSEKAKDKAINGFLAAVAVLTAFLVWIARE